MDLGLTGKVAVITGGSEGIGKAAAIRFAQEGAKVVIVARRKEPLEKAAAEVRKAGGDVLAISADAGSVEDVRRMIDETMAKFGRIDVLVNNAGASSANPFETVDDAKWKDDMEVKVFGAIRAIRGVIPIMKRQGGGRIINITMVGGKQPGAKSVPTSVSRAAGLALTKALSKEFAPDNILVNSVSVGKIKSMQHERRVAKTGGTLEGYYAENSKPIPMGRFGEAEEAGDVIVFLASARASYVTGVAVNVDGGVSGVL